MNDAVDDYEPYDRFTITRLVAALAITAGALPLCLGISLVYYVMGPRIEPFFLGGLIAGTIAILVLTWGLGSRPAVRPWSLAIFALLVVAWGVATAVLGTLRTNADPYIVAFFAVGSLWMMWLAWIGFWPIGWVARLAILAVLGSLLFVFHHYVAVTDLTGGAVLRLAWRDAVKEGVLSSLDVRTAEPVKLVPTPHDFPQFLGPDRGGIVHGVQIDPNWTGRPPQLVWKQRIGQGWGAFSIVGDYAFTLEQRGDQECTVCYELKTGKVAWVHADKTRFQSQFGGDGPRATPAVHDGKVYAVGGTGYFNCLDAATGKLLWTHNLIEKQDQNLAHGVCGSPLVVGDLVYVCPVAYEDKSLSAYDRKTGKLVFTTGGGRASYSSPALCKLAGQEQILTFNDHDLASHDPRTGKVLWTFPWGNTSGVNVAQPIAFTDGKDFVFISTAYDIGAALLQIGLDNAGNWNVANQWKQPMKSMKNKFCTSVFLGDRFVGLDDGILAACDAKTGQRLWKAGRYGHGQVLMIGRYLVVLTEDPADLVLVNPARDRNEVAEIGRLPNVLEGKTWNNLAFSTPYLLIRNSTEAACYKLPLAGEETTPAESAPPPPPDTASTTPITQPPPRAVTAPPPSTPPTSGSTFLPSAPPIPSEPADKLKPKPTTPSSDPLPALPLPPSP